MNLNFEWLSAFVEFSEHLNFTHTAAARALSQPALHTQIRKLEAQVGQSLYTRRGRQLELTPAGRQVAAFGRELRDRSAAFLGELHGTAPTAPVILAAGEGALLYLLGDVIRRFRGRHSLRLVVRDGPAAREGLREGLVHVAVAPVGAADNDAIVTAPLATVGHCLVVARDHPLAHKSSLALADLAGCQLIVPPRDRPLRQTLATALSGIDWEIAIEAEGWPLLLHLAGLGLGCAVVNDFCRIPRGLVAVPIPSLPRITYAAMRRRASPSSPALDRLWRLLIQPERATVGPG